MTMAATRRSAASRISRSVNLEVRIRAEVFVRSDEVMGTTNN
jgi:hypothetical protein